MMTIGQATLDRRTLTGPVGTVVLTPNQWKIVNKIATAKSPITTYDVGVALWGPRAPYRVPIGVKVQVHRVRRVLSAVGAGVTIRWKKKLGYHLVKENDCEQELGPV